MAKKKVLLIGWDAADWKVMHPLMDAGEMPILKKICEKMIAPFLVDLTPQGEPMCSPWL
jgi:hypothetical protein